MTPQELKNSILQLAIQGKLVEQRPEEGTAEELYREIQKEKRALIQAKKIKKGKALPEITEEEVPFVIPESWKWVRLGVITSYGETKVKIKANCIEPDMWSLDLEDIEKETGKIVNRVSAGTRKIVGDKVVFQKGDILFSKLRPYLKKMLIADEKGICSSEIVPFQSFGKISSEYLIIILKSPHVDFAINAASYGVKMPRVGTETMLKLQIPLPPLAEQHRIVAKIEELLPLIDRYEKAWNRLEDFNKRFPVDMQKSILQMAIQGKLVEQRPGEGTGEELYQQIQKEKQALVKAGKIKKGKKLPEISEEEIPFEIPESWKWVRLPEIGELNRGRSQHRPRNDPSLYEKGIYPFIQTGDVAQNDYHISTWKAAYNELGLSQSHLWPKGTLCMTIAANIGDVSILDFDACFPDSVVGFNAYQPINSNIFFLYGLMCYKNRFDQLSRSTAQKNINIGIISKIAFPLPPLAEQKRIVARLEELLPLCERLK